MTQPTRKIKTETTVMFDANGEPTTDPTKAVTAEVATTYDDGEVERNYLRKTT